MSLRVLFSVRPYRGHVHPLIPLARAFSRRGHQVAVASSDDVAPIVTGAGLAWVPAGLNPRQLYELHPRSDPDYGYHAVRAKVDDVLAASYGYFRPDVIIRDPTDLAPIIAGEVLGAFNVIYGLARFIPRWSWRILGADRTVTRLRRDFRLPPDPELESMFTDLYLSVLPRFMEVQRRLPVPAVQHIQYVPWDGDGAAANDSLVPAERSRPRPQVLMTLGTVYNTATDVFGRFLEALGGEDLDVICTLGEGSDPSVTDGAPDNVRFEQYTPHSQLLPHCDALLCHGGFNTVLGSLVAGVPVVCVPLGSDQDFNARFCEERGFGLSLDEEEATPERIRAAVRRVLSEPSFSARVSDFRQTMGRRPALAVGVRRIEGMVSRGVRYWPAPAGSVGS
jgi:UDP:flavonoid glycosyltransferase YjiC (YdhE family)